MHVMASIEENLPRSNVPRGRPAVILGGDGRDVAEARTTPLEPGNDVAAVDDGDPLAGPCPARAAGVLRWTLRQDYGSLEGISRGGIANMSITTLPETAAAPLVLGPALNGILMSAEEFDAIDEYDERYRYELIHGVLVVSPIPSPTERSLNDELFHVLRKYQEEHPQGGALDATLPEHFVAVGADRRRADRVIWAGLGRKPDFDVDPPTIVVEIASVRRRDRRRDYEEKRDEYLALGIAEYWVFDRFQRRLTVFARGAAGVEERVFGERDSYRTPRLPGFEFNVGHFLAIAERPGMELQSSGSTLDCLAERSGMNWRIRPASWLQSIGLQRQSSQPSSRHSNRLSSVECAVRATIGPENPPPRSRRVAS